MRPREPGRAFERVTAGGSLAVPLQTIKLAGDGTIWAITEQQQDAPPAVIGYDPGSEETIALTADDGIPEGDYIDDLDFTRWRRQPGLVAGGCGGADLRRAA